MPKKRNPLPSPEPDFVSQLIDFFVDTSKTALETTIKRAIEAEKARIMGENPATGPFPGPFPGLGTPPGTPPKPSQGKLPASNPDAALYKVLGVSPDAEPEVVKAAYYALQKKYHPDSGAAQTHANANRLIKINYAWEQLQKNLARPAKIG